MDVGKGVPNHYKSEFEFSTFISFLYLFCAYIVVWKKILKNPIHPPFWVFSLIIHSLCYISDHVKKFSSLMLEIPDMTKEELLFNFMDNLQ